MSIQCHCVYSQYILPTIHISGTSLQLMYFFPSSVIQLLTSESLPSSVLHLRVVMCFPISAWYSVSQVSKLISSLISQTTSDSNCHSFVCFLVFFFFFWGGSRLCDGCYWVEWLLGSAVGTNTCMRNREEKVGFANGKIQLWQVPER